MTDQIVSLREITPDNRPSIEDLQVSADQARFVDGVQASLEEAATYAVPPWIRAIYAGGTPVGFIMLADDDPTCPWRFYLWRMLIDARFQGRGFGRAAIDQLVEYVRTRPDAEQLVTSVATYDDQRDDGSPLEFYLRCGFERTGELHDREVVLRLRL